MIVTLILPSRRDKSHTNNPHILSVNGTVIDYGAGGYKSVVMGSWSN